MATPRTVAVIQARAGSTRFPRKVLADLCGKPMLAHVVERVAQAATLDDVVVATTVEAEDDVVAELATACGARVTRGPVADVLSRYVLAAREHDADVVVRVTSDCPLVDPELVDRLVRMRASARADYASNELPPTYPQGYDVEVLTAGCLRRLDVESILDYHREHVTARLREHPAEYHTANMVNDRDLSSIRLTVDVPADLDRVRTILMALPPAPPPNLAAVIAYFESDATLWDQSGLPVRDERYRAQRDAARRRDDATEIA
ncbi:MAG: cytidylyltransferase domain-containing protein [Candidatus Dormibacteria bacterium]